MSDPSTAMLLSLEGVEGAGKSTLANSLEAGLSQCGYTVLRCREPGGTSLGEAVRATVLDPAHAPVSPWSELFLMLAARAQLVQEVVEPALARGEIVLCDRFLDASAAYQGAGRELGIAAVTRLNRLATAGRWPDLTLLLDLDPVEGRGRQTHRPDRMESERLEFHRRVRAGYLEIAASEPDRFVVLDARQSTPELAAAGWAALRLRRPELPESRPDGPG
jgi:dTMP kinase